MLLEKNTALYNIGQKRKFNEIKFEYLSKAFSIGKYIYKNRIENIHN